MLVARCEVMRAMLNGDFREAHAHTVRKFLFIIKVGKNFIFVSHFN